MQQPTADEFAGLERFEFPGLIGAVFPAQLDFALRIVTRQAFLAQSRFADISGEIAQGAAALAGGPAIDHPGSLPGLRIDLSITCL